MSDIERAAREIDELFQQGRIATYSGDDTGALYRLRDALAADSAPVDWPARLRAAAEVAPGMYLGGLLLATAKELEENPVSAEAIGRALLGQDGGRP